MKSMCAWKKIFRASGAREIQNLSIVQSLEGYFEAYFAKKIHLYTKNFFEGFLSISFEKIAEN